MSKKTPLVKMPVAMYDKLEAERDSLQAENAELKVRGVEMIEAALRLVNNCVITDSLDSSVETSLVDALSKALREAADGAF